MKLGIYAIVLLVLATAAMAGTPQCPAAFCDSGASASPGNPDAECHCFGYDFGIVKYTPGAPNEYGSESDLYSISVVKNTNYDWTATPGVAGVLVKTGGGNDKFCENSGGTSGSVNGALSVSHITFCGNYEDLSCVDAIKAGLLTGTITDGTAKVTNNGAVPYTVGLAVYKVFEDEDHAELDGQVLFDSDAGVVGPGAVLDQSVNMPGCQYQIDLYCGSVITQFDKDGGVIYGDRKLDWEHDYDSDLCVNEYCGDGTVNGAEDCESASDCDDSNPFTEDICDACACEHHQTCVGCQCDNSCDPCADGHCNGVPEFSPITMLVAVAIAGLGLAYFRKQ